MIEYISTEGFPLDCGELELHGTYNVSVGLIPNPAVPGAYLLHVALRPVKSLEEELLELGGQHDSEAASG